MKSAFTECNPGPTSPLLPQRATGAGGRRRHWLRIANPCRQISSVETLIFPHTVSVETHKIRNQGVFGVTSETVISEEIP